MIYNLISCSFVGVWEKPFTNLPNLDRKFCLDLFMDPYNTTCGVTPEGFVIARQFSNPPHPSVIINPNRIQITELSLGRICDVYESIFSVLKSTNPSDLINPFASIGINTEHEWIGLPVETSTWFRKNFFQPNFLNNSDLDYMNPYDIRFEFKVKSGPRYNVLMQPRSGHKNAVFAGVNDDRFWSEKSLPPREELYDLFTDSVRVLKKQIETLF